MRVYNGLILAVLFLSVCVTGYTDQKQDVIDAVDQAVSILEEKGEAGLEEVGAIRFDDGNYVFVNDLEANTLMHIKPHLIGKNLVALKDDTGKRFFAEFTKMVQTGETEKGGVTYYNGSGWVDYRWPKPDEKEFSEKETYVKGCLMGDKNVYVGAGFYK
ncbi:MAG: hypothetical protein EOM20_02255 [Spartobacteria bacterium]|nr:hypothetical protein [Spartobacteria bacterium]